MRTNTRRRDLKKVVKSHDQSQKFKMKRESLQTIGINGVCKYILLIIGLLLLIYIIKMNISSIQSFTKDNQNKNIKHTNKKHNQLKYQSPPALKQQDNNNNKQEEETSSLNEYILFPNFMAPQIGGISKGLFEKFENRHDHNLVQLYCDSLGEQCIGYAHNTNAGYQFYSPHAMPMKSKKGWNFYFKYDQNTELNLKGTGLTIDDMENDYKLKYASGKNILPKDKLNPETETDTETELETETEPEPVEKKRYISYAQNVGRVNNQLVSFEAMIQYSIYYNRTLVIPWPRHKNHVMGLELGFWDFDKLREVIDVIVEDELPQHLQQYREEGDIPIECRFIKLVGKGIPKESNDRCEIIYLYEGDLGIFHFRDGPTNVMQYIIPAKYIRDAVEGFLIEEFGKLSYRIGVHRRAMDEGGRDPKTGTKYVCRWESRGIHGDSRFGWLRRMIKQVTGDDTKSYDKIIAMYHHSCAMDWDDLENILKFHKQDAIGSNEKFFIAHDHQEQFIIDNMKIHGGIEQPSAIRREKYSSEYWTKSHDAHKIHKNKCKNYGHCASQSTLQMKEEILFDMWALKYCDFLAGTWMSTLTRTLCHWKGFEESMYNGNQCWLKWKWERTVKHQKDDWFTLKGLNETALFDD